MSAIEVGTRVVHRRRGRGRVARLFANGQAEVVLDDEGRRRVMLHDLEREPADMPPGAWAPRLVENAR